MATLEVATLELSLRTLQDSHKTREAKRRKRRGILARLREREAKLAAAGRELAPGAGGKRAVVASAAADNPPIIYYVLGGRAGNMPIPPDGALHVDEMRENLAPLQYTDSEDTKNV